MKIKCVVVNSVDELKEYVRENTPPNVAAYKFMDNGLVDLSECWANSPELHKFPIFCTQAVWKLINDAANNPDDKDDHMDIIWDMLCMNYRFGKMVGNGSFFPVSIGGTDYRLIALINEIDIGAPWGESSIACIATLDEIPNCKFDNNGDLI